MKWLIRKKLAPRLRMTVSPETPAPSPAESRKDNSDAGDFQQDDHQLQNTKLGTTDKLLLELLHLQRAQLRSKADKRQEE